ncbi:helix-turn-helix domain-containing protein [Rhizobium sp. PAMB 3182]
MPASDAQNRVIAAFEQSAQNIISRHSNGGNREKLKLLREKLEMTQKEFAENFGIPYATVRNWEQPDRGQPNVAASLLIDLITEDPATMRGLITKVKEKQE